MRDLLNWILVFLLIYQPAFGQMNNPPRNSDQAYFAFKNNLTNPGGELGTQGWTASTTGIFYSDTISSALLKYGRSGVRGLVFNASASSQTVTSNEWALKRATSISATAQCYFKTAATDYVMHVWNTNTDASVTSATISAASSFTAVTLSFTASRSGATTVGYKIRIISASNADELYFDDCYLGESLASGAGGSGGIYGVTTNLLSNPSWESVDTNWTASAGTYARTATADHIVPPGVGAGSWDAAASGNTLTSNSTTITANDGLSGRNGVFSCAVKTAATDLKMQAYDGTNVLSANATADVVPSGSGYTRYSVNFVFPASGTVSGRFYAQSDSAIAYIDDCYLGLADGFNLYDVSQASFVASAKYAPTSGCSSWAVTSATFADFASDTDCPAPTVSGSYISSADADLPQITLTNLPPGDYLVTATFGSVIGTAGADAAYRIYDGTNELGTASLTRSNAATQEQPGMSIVGRVSYTTAGTRVLKMQGLSSSGSVSISNTSNKALEFKVYRFPNANEVGYKPDQTPQSWSGYHDTDCSWSTTSASYADPAADASCTFTEQTNRNFGTVASTGSKTPGVTFTNMRAGRYEICVSATHNNITTAGHPQISLNNGSTVLDEAGGEVITAELGTVHKRQLCGFADFTSSTAQTIKLQIKTSAGTTNLSGRLYWKIKSIDQGMSAPFIKNSVVSTYSGITRVEFVQFAKSSTAGVSCDADPCTILRQSGGITSVGWGGTGLYPIGFSPAWAEPPTCIFISNGGLRYSLYGSNPTTSAVQINTYSTAGALTNSSGDLICMGKR